MMDQQISRFKWFQVLGFPVNIRKTLNSNIWLCEIESQYWIKDKQNNAECYIDLVTLDS